MEDSQQEAPQIVTSEYSDTLSFAWWNASLSPGKGAARHSPENIAVAREAIADLLIVQKADFLALCEVNEESKSLLIEDLPLENHTVIDGFLEAGTRSKFKMFFFISERLIHISTTAVLTMRSLQTNRIALHVILFDQISQQPFHILLSHWPSRVNPNAPEKEFFAQELRRKTDQIYSDNPSANIIMMGDYNTEPASKAMNTYLMATRDAFKVKAKTGLFYNPFWRLYGEELSEEKTMGGSHYYPKHESSRWHIFDQIIVSPSLLSGTPWLFKETPSSLLTKDIAAIELMKNDSKFDHAPILISLTATMDNR